MRRFRVLARVALASLLPVTAAVAVATPAAAAAAGPAAGQYVPLEASRLFSNQSISAQTGYTFSPLGRSGIPTGGVSAVALQVHTRNATDGGNGLLQVYPTVAGGSPPATSTVNFYAGEWADNAVITKLGTSGQVTIFNGSTSGAATSVWVDAIGYYTAAGSTVTGSTYVALHPSRIVNGATTTTANGLTANVAPLGRGGVPSSGVTAVSVFVSASSSTAGDHRTYPHTSAVPSFPDAHYAAGSRYTSQKTVKLGTDGTFDITTTTPASLWVEVVGYYQDATGSATGSVFTAVSPARVPRKSVATNSTATFPLAGTAGIPALGATAVAFNLTATGQNSTAGALAVYSADADEPVARQLTYQADNDHLATQQISQVGASGTVEVKNSGSGAVELLLDVAGYFTPASPRASGLPWSSGVNPQDQNTARADEFASFRGAAVDNVTLFPERNNWTTLSNRDAIIGGLPTGFSPARDDLIMAIPLFPGDHSVYDTGTEAEWKNLATTIAGVDSDAYVRLGWEMNIENLWGYVTDDTEQAWQDSFIEAARWIKEAAPGLRIVWNPNKSWDQTCSDCSRRIFQAAKDWIDVYAIDSYDSWPADTTAEAREEHLNGDWMLNKSLAYATANGKKFAVAEWGVACDESTCQWAGHAGGDNPQYIHDYLKFFADHAGDLAFESYFDEPKAYIRSALSRDPIGPNAPAAYQADIQAYRQ